MQDPVSGLCIYNYTVSLRSLDTEVALD
jgi:hypothetical protein